MSLLRTFALIVVLAVFAVPSFGAGSATAAPSSFVYDEGQCHYDLLKQVNESPARPDPARIYAYDDATNPAHALRSPARRVLAAKAGSSLDDLARAAQASERGGQTAAGRALQKHGDRAGCIYPRIGSPAERSRVAQDIVEDYLTNPLIRERVRRDVFGSSRCQMVEASPSTRTDRSEGCWSGTDELHRSHRVGGPSAGRVR